MTVTPADWVWIPEIVEIERLISLYYDIKIEQQIYFWMQ